MTRPARTLRWRIAAWLTAVAMLFADLAAPLAAPPPGDPTPPGPDSIAICTPDGIVYVSLPGRDRDPDPGETPIRRARPCVLCLVGTHAPAFPPIEAPTVGTPCGAILRHRRPHDRRMALPGRPIRRPGRPRDPPGFR